MVTLKADCEQRAQDGTDEVSAGVPFNASNQAGEPYDGSDEEAAEGDTRLYILQKTHDGIKKHAGFIKEGEKW